MFSIHLAGHLNGIGFLVGAPGDECIEHIHRTDNARLQGDIFSGKTLRLALAVVFFMVVQGDLTCDLQYLRLGAAQDFRADGGVGFHQLELVGGEFSGAQQNFIRYADFPHIMHGGGEFEILDDCLGFAKK